MHEKAETAAHEKAEGTDHCNDDRSMPKRMSGRKASRKPPRAFKRGGRALGLSRSSQRR